MRQSATVNFCVCWVDTSNLRTMGARAYNHKGYNSGCKVSPQSGGQPVCCGLDPGIVCLNSRTVLKRTTTCKQHLIVHRQGWLRSRTFKDRLASKIVRKLSGTRGASTKEEGRWRPQCCGDAWPNMCCGKPRKSGKPEDGDFPSEGRTTCCGAWCGLTTVGYFVTAKKN